MVELRGSLRAVLKYGPPNYGETPETDERLTVPILVLAEPVSVTGDSTSDLNRESLQGIKEIQLAFLKNERAYEPFVNARVVVSGTLVRALSGHDFTPVVLEVRTISMAR